jgi:hypothetical protein
MQCTLCEAPYIAEHVGTITLDRCSRCRALWFDRTELAGAVDARVQGIAVEWGQPLPTPVDEGPLCPRTPGVRLRRYEWLGERFWRCSSCQGVLMTSRAWEGMLAAAMQRRAKAKRRSGVQGAAELVLEVLGAGFF